MLVYIYKTYYVIIFFDPVSCFTFSGKVIHRFSFVLMCYKVVMVLLLLFCKTLLNNDFRINQKERKQGWGIFIVHLFLNKIIDASTGELQVLIVVLGS